MARLFVAAWPPEDVLDRVAELERPDVAGLRWTGRDRWHVTLRFLGEGDIGAATEALRAVEVGKTEAVLGPAVGRFGNRVLHVPVAGLDGVASAVVGVTTGIGKPPEDRPFNGHLTLARVAKGARVNLRAMAGQPIGGRWVVDDFCLVQSRLARSGAAYEVLERFSLR